MILVQVRWEGLPPTETKSHKGNGPILWLNCKQPCIATSTTESEYVVASLTNKEVVWACRLLADKQILPLIFSDYQSAIRLVRNPEFHKRIKHIDVVYHLIRELQTWGNISNMFYVPTKLLYCRAAICCFDVKLNHVETISSGNWENDPDVFCTCKSFMITHAQPGWTSCNTCTMAGWKSGRSSIGPTQRSALKKPGWVSLSPQG